MDDRHPTLPSWFVEQVCAMDRDLIAKFDPIGISRAIAIRASALCGMPQSKIPEALGISGQAYRMWRSSIPAQDDGRGAQHYLFPPRGRPRLEPSPFPSAAMQPHTPSAESLLSAAIP